MWGGGGGGGALNARIMKFIGLLFCDARYIRQSRDNAVFGNNGQFKAGRLSVVDLP